MKKLIIYFSFFALVIPFNAQIIDVAGVGLEIGHFDFAYNKHYVKYKAFCSGFMQSI